jgi:lysophospholipase L1-like esterase
MKRLRLVVHASALVLFAAVAAAQPALAPQANPDRWEPEIRKFEEADRRQAPPQGAVLFVGASSIRRWTTLAADFPGVAVINRGFGGSEYDDIIRYFDRIVLPYKPNQIVIYSGDNDLARGKTPERVVADFKQIVQLIHAKLPKARVGVIAIKPSLARWSLNTQILAADAMLKALADQDERLEYIDIAPLMLGADGKPDPELFVEDGLHLTPKGYAIWTAAVKRFLK